MPSAMKIFESSLQNPVASAQFYYTVGSRMAIQFLSNSNVGEIFWTTLADAITDYDLMVLHRMRETCGGFGVMAGAESPLGVLTTKWCTVYPNLQSSLLQLSTVFFVDIPLMACVCKKSQGNNFFRYVTTSCWPQAPLSYKPLLLALLDTYADNPTAVCQALLTYTQNQFTTAFDPVFQSLEDGIGQVANVLDSLVGFIDPDAGQCKNYANNPYVMVSPLYF